MSPSEQTRRIHIWMGVIFIIRYLNVVPFAVIQPRHCIIPGIINLKFTPRSTSTSCTFACPWFSGYSACLKRAGSTEWTIENRQDYTTVRTSRPLTKVYFANAIAKKIVFVVTWNKATNLTVGGPVAHGGRKYIGQNYFVYSGIFCSDLLRESHSSVQFSRRFTGVFEDFKIIIILSITYCLFNYQRVSVLLF